MNDMYFIFFLSGLTMSQVTATLWATKKMWCHQKELVRMKLSNNFCSTIILLCLSECLLLALSFSLSLCLSLSLTLSILSCFLKHAEKVYDDDHFWVDAHASCFPSCPSEGSPRWVQPMHFVVKKAHEFMQGCLPGFVASFPSPSSAGFALVLATLLGFHSVQ